MGHNPVRWVHYSLSALIEFHNRADLNRPICGSRNLSCPLDGFIEVLTVKQVIPPKLLFCLGKRTIRGECLASTHPHRCRSIDRHKSLTAQESASFLEFFSIGRVGSI